MNKVYMLSGNDLTKYMAEVCQVCSEGNQLTCAHRGLFNNDDERAEFHNSGDWGCTCGQFYENYHACRMCPEIRNGVCDGPEVHCEDTMCEHRHEKVCPVPYTECNWKYARYIR